MKFLIIAILFVITACQHKPEIATAPAPKIPRKARKDLVFPDGKYFQDVKVHIHDPKGDHNFSFDAIIKKQMPELVFIGESTFGATIFTMRRKADGQIEFETSIHQIQEHKDFLTPAFQVMEMTMKMTDDELQKNHDEMHVKTNQHDNVATFSDFDDKGIPLTLKIESPGIYNVDVKTTKYELKTDTDHH